MSEESKLEKAVNAYLNLAKAELRPHRVKTLNPIPLDVQRTGLRHLVERAENSPQFAELVKQTEKLFPVDKGRAYMRASQISELPVFGEVTKIPDYDFNRIQNYFRRSRNYTSLYRGENVDVGTVYKNFLDELGKKRIRVQYLLPVDCISFGADCLEFDGFQIRRFSAEELNEIVQNDVREVFYPWHTAELSEIEAYWFVVIEEFVEASTYGVHRFPSVQPFSPTAKEELGSFPVVVERALEPFILVDWDSLVEFPLEESMGFEVPFVLEVADDLLRPLDSVPEMRPLGGPLSEDEETGSPSYDVEQYWYDIEMTADQARAFHSFVTEVNSILTRLKSEWTFLEVSLLFLKKAFFSKGLERLLSHVTVIEALLGEDKEGLTNLLKRRLALILGKTKKERTKIRDIFQEIYELRSDLVHGNEGLVNPKTTYTHLREARNLARRTVLWFIRYLDYVRAETLKDKRRLPAREELLLALDIEVENRERIIERNESVNHLLTILRDNVSPPSQWFDV